MTLKSVWSLFFAVVLASSVSAQNKTALEELAGMLSGEFESRQQMQEDLDAGLADGKRHYWVNRTFQQVEAPEVGSHVFVATTEYNFNRWIFDFNEFYVWTLEVADNPEQIVMTPRRFKEQEKKLPFAREAWKLAGFGPDDLEAARGGGACTIVWMRTAEGFMGESEPCSVMSTTKGKMLDWEWRFDLMPQALFVEFNGRDETGASLDGTDGMAPYRLDRVAP